jgi:putative oxidoreductase
MASNGGFMGSLGLLVLRVGTSAILFGAHGWAKIANFAERSRSFPDPINIGSTPSFWLVVTAEVFCTTLVALGLFTRAATIPLIGFFSIAFFIHHAPDPFRQKELALVFLFVYAAIFALGPGKFALDTWISVRLKKGSSGD